MKKISLLLFLALGVLYVNAGGNPKSSTLVGKVVDMSGEAIIGAKVQVEGSDEAVYSDFEGNFMFKSIPQLNQNISVQSISFEDKTAQIDLKSSSNQEILIQLRSK